VRIFISLNSCLQDVLVLTATIDLITRFYILSILVVNSPPAPPPPPPPQKQKQQNRKIFYKKFIKKKFN